MGWSKGKRQIRIKTAIVNILKDAPEGLSATELQDRLKESSKGRKAAPNVNAIAQLCARTKGIERAQEDRTISTGYDDGSTRFQAVWFLADEEAFRAWAE